MEVGEGYVAIHRPHTPNRTHHAQLENGSPFRSSTFYPFNDYYFHDYFPPGCGRESGYFTPLP
jgi:hypothetical protein